LGIAESEYRFKHALIQDAAYENLLKSRRQVLHRRVAEVLREKFADSAAAEPELLAHHFTQAGLIEAAIEWWGKAGQRSLERSALVEAVAQLTRALDQIGSLPATSPCSSAIRVNAAAIIPAPAPLRSFAISVSTCRSMTELFIADLAPRAAPRDAAAPDPGGATA
jgi:hypothetical protein